MAKAAEKRKEEIVGQQQLAKQLGAELVPFAVETYGAFGPKAIDTLKRIYAAAEHWDISLTEMIQTVAIAVQYGNWQIIELGVSMSMRPG